MAGHRTKDIRSIALVGHSGAGKTLLMEQMLTKAGQIRETGSIERGSTVGDFDPMEQEHGHSLDSSLAYLTHRDRHIQIIDTPGYPDFRGPTLAAAAAVETTAVVINAQAGIELNTHRMMQRAADRKLCRMIVVNKIDAEDIDLTALVREIRKTFGNRCLPINLPADNYTHVVDTFFNPEGESDIFSVEAAHTEITDQVVEVDEALMEAYLEQGELEKTQLHDAFEKALRQGHLVPICFTSALTGAGVQSMLDMIARLMPNPREGNPPPFLKGEGSRAQPVTATPDPGAHVLAHVFKITNDPFVGKLSVMRVYQGTITRDSQLYVGEARKPFKVGHLFKLLGKKHDEVESAVPGDLVAVAKVEEIEYDAVLHDSHDEDNYHLKPLDFPKPMFGLAIEAKSRGHEQKLSTALHKLEEEDPCFEVEHSAELNETVIRGLGDLHLRIMLERMHKRYGVEVDTRPPRIAYRETIRANAEGHHRHKKQTGGAGQFGEVFLRVEPLDRGEGFEFVDQVVGGVIPHNLIPAVEKGIRQVLVEGAIAGYPFQDVRVTVFDGKHHPVDSKEVAFMMAGKKAFLDAIQKAKPQVLEPVVDIQVTVPADMMGDVTGGLASKRARINGTDSVPGGQMAVNALVPLSEITDYQTELKSMTGGHGRYTMEFSHYDPVPSQVQQQLVSAHRPAADAD